jgi:hypothetical protein
LCLFAFEKLSLKTEFLLIVILKGCFELGEDSSTGSLLLLSSSGGLLFHSLSSMLFSSKLEVERSCPKATGSVW